MKLLPKITKIKQENGFTLIELLIVVGLIGALAGITMVTINPEAQEEFAQDSVRRKHLKDTADALETYFVAERSYPAEGTTANRNPLDASAADNVVARSYVEEWPADIVYTLDSGVFSVHLEKASDTGVFFKYNSDWQEIRECTDVSGVNSCT